MSTSVYRVWNPSDEVGDESYSERVLLTDPVAYWPLWERSGTVAECLVNSAQDGTYTGVTLANASIPVIGTVAPYFDGTNDYVDVYSATLAAAFSGVTGTVMAWAKVNAAAVWTDGTERGILRWSVNAANYIHLAKMAANNTVRWLYRAGGVNSIVNNNALSTTDWMMIVMTWDAAADQMKAYYNGTQEGATQNGLGVWAGGLGVNTTLIGANVNAPNAVWHGWLAHCAIWDKVIDASTIAELANPMSRG